MATSFASVPIGLATSILLARYLGPHDMGLYSVLINIATISLLLSQFGWPSATIYRHRRMGQESSVVATSAIVAMTIASVFCVLGLWIFRAEIQSRFNNQLPDSSFLLLLGLIPAQLFGRAFVGIARAIGRFDLANWYQLVQGLALLIFVAALFVGIDLGIPALNAALCGLVLANWIGTLIIGASTLAVSGLRRRYSPSDLLESLRYGSKSYLQTLAGQVHEQIDVLMLAAMLVGPGQIACYAIGVGISNRLKLMPAAIANALFPHAAGLPERESALVTARASRNAILWVTISAIGAGLIAPWFVEIAYGTQYEDAVFPLLALLPAGVLLTSFRVLSRYFMAVDRQMINVSVQAISVVINVGLNFWLIPLLGIRGAATATLFTYGLEFVLLAVLFRTVTGIGYSKLLIVDRADLHMYRVQLSSAFRRIRSAG